MLVKLICMAMAEPTIDNSVNYRNKTKNAYLRMRNCSPKFRSVLRQRYRERVQNSRHKLLDSFRHIDVEKEKSNEKDRINLDGGFYKEALVQELLNSNEVSDLEQELMIEEALEEELSQYENWLLQEYELIWDWEENDDINITCPLCCSGRFEIQYSTECVNKICCQSCSSFFYTPRSLSEIENDIFNEVDNHKRQCSSDPAFVYAPGGESQYNLCIVCDICSYLQIVI